MARTLCFLWLVLTPVLAWADPPSEPQDICALMTGEQVPSGLTALDSSGEPFDLSAALQSQPTLLIFYRGGW
ncbi:hypothetical protein DRQ53_14400 [bacterium]|nr:MAG: hypothetical protein DRQ53_14400 [bacterium]RKZ13024.1 MAG: hypothetical protein DRQ32_02440 [bacterium]